MAADKSLHARIYLNHQGENMHEKQQKELLIKRILKYLPDAPDDAAQRLLQETVADLEHMLAAQSEKHAKQEAAERVSQHAAQMRRESQKGQSMAICSQLFPISRTGTTLRL
jgi:hypothetical protein